MTADQRKWIAWMAAAVAFLVVALVFDPLPFPLPRHEPKLDQDSLSGCEASAEHERLVAKVDLLNSQDSAPYRVGDDWVLDRTLTLRANCSYEIYATGQHVRSYSLPSRKMTQQVTLCSGGSAVASYSGPCPPQ